VKHRNTVYTENQFLREDFGRLQNKTFGGTQCRSWLRQWAASRRVAGSIPDCRIFHRRDSSGLIFGPGVDSFPSSKWYQEYLLGGKDGQCVRLATLPLSCADFLEIWKPQPSETLRAYSGLYSDSFYLLLSATNFR
jgi:hypothetical protein